MRELGRDWKALELAWSPKAAKWCVLETPAPTKGLCCGEIGYLTSSKGMPSPGTRPCGNRCLRLPLLRDACRLVWGRPSTSMASLLLGEFSICCETERVVALGTKVALGSLWGFSGLLLDLLGIPGSLDGATPNILNPRHKLLQNVATQFESDASFAQRPKRKAKRQC